jgi:hypothetical protein
MVRGEAVRVESRTWVEERRGTGTEQEPLLAAALAAALVEYRRYVGPGNERASADDDNAKWRIAGRLEQLRSRA